MSGLPERPDAGLPPVPDVAATPSRRGAGPGRRRTSLGAGDEGPSPRRLAWAGVVVLVLLGLVTYLSTVAIDGGPLSDPYEVRAEAPPGAPVLKDGDEVRVGGLRAGTVREVRAGRRGAELRLALDEGPVGRDATARIRLRGLAGAVYVDLEPGDAARAPLPDGGRLRAGAVGTSTDLAQLVGAFGAAERTGVRRALRGYGLGVSGRGDDLAGTLDDLTPAARRLTPLARAAAPGRGVLAGLLGDVRTISAAVASDGPGSDARSSGPTTSGDRSAAPGSSDAARTSAARTSAARASDAARLVRSGADVVASLEPRPVRATLAALPRLERTAAAALPEADALLAAARPAVRELRPAARALRAALPDLEAALRARRGLDELTAAGRAAAPVLRAAAPLVGELRGPAKLLAPLAGPLGPLGAYLAPYREELLLAPLGFTRWGDFAYGEGQAKGSRAVRFTMVLTCARARDPYPAPGEALTQEARCR